MQFVIEKENLKKALDIASLGLDEKSSEPIQGYYLVEIDAEGKAHLRANNRFLFSEARMDIMSGSPGKMVVPGGSLKELCKSLEDGPVTFSLEEEGTVTVNSGNATISLVALPSENFIYPSEDLTGVPTETYSISHLTEALKYMKSFIGQDKNKLHYMVTELRNGHWMASDGVKIGMYERDDFPGNVIIQTKALNSVLSFLKGSDGEGVVITSTEKFCWISDGMNRLAFRRDDRKFSPEIETVLSQVEPKDHIQVNKDLLESVVQRLKIALDSGDSRMEFTICGDEEGRLKVRTVNARGKESLEQIPVRRVEGEEQVQFVLDWRPLLDTLQSNPFSEGMLHFYFIPDKSVIKLYREEEDMRAISFISLHPSGSLD